MGCTQSRRTTNVATARPATHPSTALLHQLHDIMGKSIAKLDKICLEKELEVPDLNEPFHPASEAFRQNPSATEAAHTAATAALHISAILSPPQVSLYHAIGGHFRSSAIRTCIESHVSEILREAGPNGLHVDQIAEINGQDAHKLARFLRILATDHVYKEVTPDVFTNTRISSMLDTMRPIKEILANPNKKYENTLGLSALAAHHLDEAFKASAWSWETLADPSTRHSGSPNTSPFSRAFKTNATLWEFFDHKEESYRRARFTIGMRGVQALQPPDSSLKAYDWASLAPGSVVVDVGGGMGTATAPLVREFPKLQYVVQDLPSAIEEGKQWWGQNSAESVDNGQVRLQVHDFFEPQPEKNVSIFFLKQIMHDWSDTYCTKILNRLYEAATPTTKLILMESIIPYACHDPSADNGSGVPGGTPREAPAPLLANWGSVNEMGYYADIDMFLLCNSQERTMRHLQQLLRNSNWKITLVRRSEGDSTFLQSIEAVPIGKEISTHVNS